MSENDSLHMKPVHALSRVALGLALATTFLSIVAVFAVGANGSEPVATLCIGCVFVVATVEADAWCAGLADGQALALAEWGPNRRPGTSAHHITKDGIAPA